MCKLSMKCNHYKQRSPYFDGTAVVASLLGATRAVSAGFTVRGRFTPQSRGLPWHRFSDIDSMHYWVTFCVSSLYAC
jgi:hypothetical protein